MESFFFVLLTIAVVPFGGMLALAIAIVREECRQPDFWEKEYAAMEVLKKDRLVRKARGDFFWWLPAWVRYIQGY